jgi:hypothetical protein
MAGSNDYAPLYQAAGQANNVDPTLLAAIGMTEDASGDPNAVSSAGAEGNMQLMPRTASSLGVQNPADPSQAIPGAAALMAQNLKAANGNVPLAVMTYFGGPDRSKWGPKTYQYPVTVAANYQKLKAQQMPQSTTSATAPLALGDLDAAFGSASSPATTPQASATPLQQSDLDAAFAAPAGPPRQSKPGIAGSFMAGVLNGVHSATNAPAEALATAATKLGIPQAAQAGLERLGVSPQTAQAIVPTGDTGPTLTSVITGAPTSQIAAQDQAAHAAYQQRYAGNPAAAVGNFAGQTAIVAPLIASGGNLLTAGAEGAGMMPVVGNAARAGINFLTGTGGAGVRGIGGTVARTASRALAGAGAGAAAAGLTSSDSPAPLGQQMAQGAEIGAGVGVAAPVVGAALAAGGSVLRNAASGISDLSPAMVQRAATNKLTASLAADGLTPAQAIAKLRAGGPDAILPDVAGPNTIQTARATAAMPGQAAAQAQATLDGRMAEQVDNVNAAIQKATGQQGAVVADTGALAAQRAAAARPLFASAYENTIPTAGQIAKVAPIIASPDGQKALASALTTMQRSALANGAPFDPADIGLVTDDAGHLAVAPGTQSLPLLAAVKEGLDDTIEGSRDQVTGKLPNTKEANALDALRNSYRTQLTTMFPDYGAALDAWSGPSRSMEAMRMGQKALTNDPAVTANVVSGLSDGDKQFFLNGLTKAAIDKVNTTSQGGTEASGNAVARIFGTPAMKAKLQAAFPSPAAYDAFAQTMAQESQKVATRNAIRGGSRTDYNLSGIASNNADYLTPTLHALQGNFGGAAAHVLGQVKNYLLAPSQAVNDAAGNILFTPGNADALEAYFARSKPGPIGKSGNALTDAAARSAVPALTLAAQQNYGRP